MFAHTTALRRSAWRLQSRAAFSTETAKESRLVDGLIRQRRPRALMAPRSSSGDVTTATADNEGPPPAVVDEEAVNRELELNMMKMDIKTESAPSLDFSAALTRGNHAQKNLGVIENIHEDNVRLEPKQFHNLLTSLVPFAGDERARVNAAEEWLEKHSPALVPQARQIARLCGLPVLREQHETLLLGTWE